MSSCFNSFSQTPILQVDYTTTKQPLAVPSENSTTLIQATGIWVKDYACKSCQQKSSRICFDCGCSVCGGKDGVADNVVCDECEEWTHWRCLNPPLEVLPDGDWFCPKCYNDPGNVVLPTKVSIKNLNVNEKATRTGKKGRSLGGMANVGHSKTCTIVPSNHRGPIPGIHVGQSWKFRASCGSDGVHRPPISGIAGSATNGGAVSIVLSGGYPEDRDDGLEFVYTGSGGRDLKDKRTAAQTKDQELTRDNLALAMTCNAKVCKNGAVAKNWTQSLGIRVVRGYKLDSQFAPKEGYRYDGIYKLLKYDFSKGESDHMVYRYHFRRDDNVPAPWTDPGKRLIKELSLRMILPPNLDSVGGKNSDMERVDNDKNFDTKNDNDDANDEENIPLTYATIRLKRGQEFHLL